jgi:hypothetical protein
MVTVSIRYPIAADANAALNAPRGRAAREAEARRVAGESVTFVREFTGPVFKTEAAALDAWAGRIDDIRPGASVSVALDDRFCALKPIAERGRMPFAGVQTVWRLSVAYWRIGGPPADKPNLPQARKARRGRAGAAPDGDTLNALADQPLRPIKPQQPLDIGLFEMPLPENPGLMIPDE